MTKVSVYGADLKLWWLEIISPYIVGQLSIIILNPFHCLKKEKGMPLNGKFKTIQVISCNSCKCRRFETFTVVNCWFGSCFWLMVQYRCSLQRYWLHLQGEVTVQLLLPVLTAQVHGSVGTTVLDLWKYCKFQCWCGLMLKKVVLWTNMHMLDT